MSSLKLDKLSISIFGESHGKCIGGVITGLEAGHEIDLLKLKEDMDRRRPGNDNISTKRSEADEVEIISGIKDGATTGAPLTVIINNTDQKSHDYNNLHNIPRPSHSDYAAFVKYKGFNDLRGGGHFSGRLTAPLVAIGSICKQILQKKDVTFETEIYQIGNIYYDGDESKKKMIELIKKVQADNNSVGGRVQCSVHGVRAGLGGPLFDGIEGKLSVLLFGIPGVKAVEFGLGVLNASSLGSEVNDQFQITNNEVTTLSNNCGGILGGITSGMPLVSKVTFKPTPSIFKPQKSVDLNSATNEILEIKGRHDPCIALRGIPVVESVMAIGILDILS